MTQEQLERDVRDHSRILTELIAAEQRRSDRERGQAEIEILKEKHLDERLERIEEWNKSILGLGRWILGAVGTTLITVLITFALKGGLFGP